MSNISQTVSLLEDRLKKLLENYTFLKEENELLFSKVAALEMQLIKEEQHFSKLKNAYNTLKLAKTINGSIKENSRETKSKINALIREVDACIKQLNK